MFGERGQFYFHFTTAEAAFEFILPDGLLRLSPHSILRDPLEYKDWEFGEFAGAYWAKNMGEGVALRALAEATDALNEVRKCTKVLALTVDPPGYDGGGSEAYFGRGYASARMWEHYADNHAGVCLVFDRQALDHALRDQLTRQDPIPGMTQTLFDGPVTYLPAGRAGAGSARGLSLSGEIDHREKAARHFEAHVEDLLFLKTKDWESEFEHRYALVSAGQDYDYVAFGEALEAVIVGERFPMWQSASAIQLCKESGADPKQLTFTKDAPFVVPLVPWEDLEPHLRAKSRRLRHGPGSLPPTG